MRQLEHQEHQPTTHHGRQVELILANLKDPLNVGHAFRMAASLGIKRLYLTGNTPTPPNAKLNRTARGSQHEVPFVQGDTLEVVRELQATGARVLALEYATESVDIRTRSTPEDLPVALLVGNEAHGVLREVLVACDEVVHLPMYGKISSLNVATALAMGLWELVR